MPCVQIMFLLISSLPPCSVWDLPCQTTWSICSFQIESSARELLSVPLHGVFYQQWFDDFVAAVWHPCPANQLGLTMAPLLCHYWSCWRQRGERQAIPWHFNTSRSAQSWCYLFCKFLVCLYQLCLSCSFFRDTEKNFLREQSALPFFFNQAWVLPKETYCYEMQSSLPWWLCISIVRSTTEGQTWGPTGWLW